MSVLFSALSPFVWRSCLSFVVVPQRRASFLPGGLDSHGFGTVLLLIFRGALIWCVGEELRIAGANVGQTARVASEVRPEQRARGAELGAQAGNIHCSHPSALPGMLSHAALLSQRRGGPSAPTCSRAANGKHPDPTHAQSCRRERALALFPVSLAAWGLGWKV